MLFRPAEAQRYTFQKIGLEQGIPSARINGFLEDSRGFFWIATEGAGLVRYDGFEFKSIDIGNESIRPIVTALAEDRDGNIWFASESILIKYDGLDFRFFYLPERQERIIKIIPSENGKLLAAGRAGVYSMGSGDTLDAYDLKIKGAVNDAAFRGKELWLATDSALYVDAKKIAKGKWNGISVFKGKVFAQSSDTFRSEVGTDNLNFLKGEKFCLTENLNVALRSDSVVISEGNNKVFLHKENGLPKEDFKGCYIDKAGVLWLYSNNGLTKLPSMAVRLFDNIEGEVFSVMKNGENLYAGTGNGLNITDGKSFEKVTGAAFPYGVILSMAFYDGYYWLGTERGLVRYDGNSFRRISLDETQEGYIFALRATTEGLWIGTGMGIFRYRNGRAANISERENLPMASIYAISEGADGSLWFATYIQGFFRKSGPSWENIRELGGMRMDSLRFNSFTAVSQNELWAGSLSEGIFHVSETGVTNIAPAEMNFAEPRSMALDSAGKLWVGTNKGLYKIDPGQSATKPRLINQTRQLLTEGFTTQAMEITDGLLLAGTSNGLLSVDLRELEKSRTTPKIVLTDLEFFFGEVEVAGEYAEGTTAFTQIPFGFELPHDLNFISFTLAGLSGYQPEDLIYRYRISPQQNWTLAGTRREAVFSNLPPDNYEFQAQVARVGEEWGEAMVSYPFRIDPPLWQQWWFITVAVLLLAGLTYWYMRDRINRLNQRLILEKSLVDMERKALRLQMNPHFIFNALDSISSFIFRNDPKQAVKYLNNFAKLMRLTLESSMEHVHPVETEVSILKNYLELEKLRFRGKLEYSIELDEEIDYDVGIPPMLIQPHVENAILHGIKPKEGSGTVAIRFVLDDEMIICEVEDDGIGRRRSKELAKRKDHRSMATQINRGRLELLRKAMGEKVDIQIIDKENDGGTKVVIKLPAEAI